MRQRRPLTRRPWVEQLEGRLVPSTSSNWSGYAVLAARNTVTAVYGSWVVPAVTGTGTAYSSAWLGIDGDGSSTVEQLGTDSDLSRGTPVYYAWYEMYPAGSVNLSLTIHPGDTISASVTYASSKFTLQLTDDTSGKSFSITKSSSSARRSSAEWIQEAPSGGRGVLPLADFGTINFSGASATISGTPAPIDGPFGTSTSLDEITMVDRGATATPSAPPIDSGSPVTSSFTVTFASAGGTQHGGNSGGSGATSRRQPDVLLVQAAVPFVGSASGVLTTAAAPSGQSGPAAFAPVVTSATAASFAPLGGALGGHAGDAAPANSAPATPPAEPELLPPPAENGGPAAPRTNPDAVPAPSDDESPACLEGSAAAYRGACDACFVDGRWAPSAPEQSSRAESGGDDGTTAGAAAGLLLTLAVGGSWHASREDGPARRRRPRLR